MSRQFKIRELVMMASVCFVSAPVMAQTAAAPEEVTAPVETAAEPTAAPAAAPAATARTDSSSYGIEEIVVTARRKEERLQSTPVAVTAVSEEMLTQSQIISVADMQRTAPNVAIATGSPATSGFTFVSIRGQQNFQVGVGNDPAVGTYIDGVYIARPSQGQMDLEDVQRVEVLRGPQGTLFGRNTIGGALNIITQQPKDVFEASLRQTVGSFDQSDVGGMVNLPLSDAFAARLVAHHKERGGFGFNATENNEVYDVRKDDFGRFQLRWNVSDDWSATASADYNELIDSGQLTTLSGWTDATGVFGATGVNLDQYLHTHDRWYTGYLTGTSAADPRFKIGNELRTYGFAANVNGDFGWAQFKSITSWRSSDSAGYQDLDGTAVQILQLYSSWQADQFSQELQLSGENGAFSWIGGAFFFTEQGREQSITNTFGYRFPGGPATVPQGSNYGDASNQSYAAFAQGYYQISDALRAAVGFRWTVDSRKMVIHNQSDARNPNNCTVPFPDGGAFPPCNQTSDTDFDYPAWMAGLDYQVNPNLFVYAKTSAAYMAGGWNVRAGAAPAFDPQQLIDAELGVKADWFDRRLRTNLALFHSWQKDSQRNLALFVNGASTQYVVNAGNAQIDGLELEVTALPWQGMELTATLGLMSGGYDAGTYKEAQGVTLPAGSATPAGCTAAGAGPGGSVNVSCVTDRSDEELPQLPEITYALGATQTFEVPGGSLALHADYSYIAEQTFEERTPADAQPAAVKARFERANELGRTDAYGVLNARLSYQLTAYDLEIALWGRNLADEEYVTRSFADLYSTLGTAVEFVGAPRTYGLTAVYRFGG